jgi:hypothetical protein
MLEIGQKLLEEVLKKKCLDQKYYFIESGEDELFWCIMIKGNKQIWDGPHHSQEIFTFPESLVVDKDFLESLLPEDRIIKVKTIGNTRGDNKEEYWIVEVLRDSPIVSGWVESLPELGIYGAICIKNDYVIYSTKMSSKEWRKEGFKLVEISNIVQIDLPSDLDRQFFEKQVLKWSSEN